MVLFLTALVVLMLALLATDTALSVWQQLADAPAWLRWTYGGVLAVVTLLVTLLSWRWLWPRKAAPKTPNTVDLDPDAVDERIRASGEAGVDVSEAVAELAEHRRRRQAGEVHLAVFGEVSTGKSSLVRALLPAAEVDTDPRAGTTTDIRHHHWTSPSGDRVVIADLPGFNLDDDPAVLEEARRAHLVLFLCDADLTRTQAEQLKRLQTLDKPLLVALNKADRYSDGEIQSLRERIAQSSGLAPERFVTLQTGGREEVIRQLADGTEQTETRERPPEVETLRRTIQRDLDRNGELMESLRDSAVLLMASEKLESARQAHLAEQAAELVRTYSRRAVVGALAAVAPGSDLVIQGVLATRLIQELCDLYEVSVKEVQVESFLRLAGGKVRKMSALTLAIAGNALKAFPGIGTLSGGLLHAVAYGMIFDSLGRAAADTLASRGELRPLPAAEAFGERLNEHLESGAGRFAKLAIAEFRDKDAS